MYPLITCWSNEVPIAESFAFWYRELIRAGIDVCESDELVIYVPIPAAMRQLPTLKYAGLMHTYAGSNGLKTTISMFGYPRIAFPYIASHLPYLASERSSKYCYSTVASEFVTCSIETENELLLTRGTASSNAGLHLRSAFMLWSEIHT